MKMTRSEAATIAGRVGGPARAASMTPEARKAQARHSANVRWENVRKAKAAKEAIT